MFDNYTRVKRDIPTACPVWRSLDLSQPVGHGAPVATKGGDRRRALADAVKARRLQLGLTQGDIADRGGPSIVTVRQIEKVTGPPPSDLSLAGLDRALRWEHGSAQAILDGGQAVVSDLSAVPDLPGTDVRQAILDDPHLLPIARAHLLNQYDILLRLQNTPPEMLLEQERRRQEAEVEERGQAILRGIAEAEKAKKKTSPKQRPKG